MPAKYKSIIGYGLKFEPDYDAIDPYSDLGQDFNSVIEKMYPKLCFEYAGDLWNGGKGERYAFAKSSVIEQRREYGDKENWGKEISFPTDVPNDEIAELWEFIEKGFISEGSVTWHLITGIH